MRWRVLLLSIILLQLVSAVSTNLAPVYQPGETIIIKIDGNILEPITPADIIFKRNHVAIAVNYDVKRIGESYYLYAQAPFNKNNYTLFINDISTTVNGQVTSLDFNQSFKVDGNNTDYSVSPGFAILNGDDLELVVNLYLDQPINIMTNFPDERAIILNPGSNTVSLSTLGKASGIYQVNIGKYILPVQIISNVNSQNQTQSSQILISPQTINRVLLSNSNYSLNISIFNNGSSALENIQFLFDSDLFVLSPSTIVAIAPGESKDIELKLLKNSGLIIKDLIIYNSNEQLATFKINISFTTNPNQTSIGNNSLVSEYYCSELSGVFCTANEVCSSDPIQSLDGLCCTGTCSIEEESSFGWIGYLSIAVVLSILIFMYLRYRKTAIPVSKPGIINPLAKKH
ncbi:MAG: hypothetical protein ACP5NS_04715 [Candidatus Pacearchaeota archaeon]